MTKDTARARSDNEPTLSWQGLTIVCGLVIAEELDRHGPPPVCYIAGVNHPSGQPVLRHRPAKHQGFLEHKP
jgi:hypothetical protein